ncbi:global transcription factor group, partial [Trifolium pratense]
GKPLMDFESIKLKLEKGLYLTTDEFASDVRIVFYNATVLHRVSRSIQRIAMKLSELFEMKWKYLEEKWETEKEKNKEEKSTAKPKETVTTVCGSVSYTARNNKRKFELDISKKSSNIDAKLSAKKAKKQHVTEETTFFDAKFVAKKVVMDTTTIKPKKEHVVDSILASQSKLFGCCNDVSLERKKQRKVAELTVRNIVQTVFIDDNLDSFKELERLCGHSLQDYKLNPLKKFVGLVLKDEFVRVTDLNEDKFLNRDWEEGEIIILD